MSRFTLRIVVVFTLFALLMSSCSVLDLLPQSAPPAEEVPAPEETVPEEVAPEEIAPKESQPTQPEEPASHGDTPEETEPVAEAQVITVENAHLLQEVAQVQIENPYRLEWSQDGTRIGMLALNGMSVLDGKTLETLSNVVVQQPIYVLDFSPTTGLMATTSDQENLDLREISTGEIVRTISPERGFIDAVFSRDGSQIALSSFDKIAVTLYSSADGTEIKELSGFATAAPAYSVSFSKDDQYLIWIARGCTQVMDVSSGALGAHLCHEDFIGDAELAPNGHMLAVSSAGTVDGKSHPIVQLWDQTSGLALGMLVEGSSITQSLAYSQDGKLLVVSVFNELALWDVDAKTRLLALPGHTDLVKSIAISPDGRTLVSASADGTVRLWQTR